jgi:hypothetical protein
MGISFSVGRGGFPQSQLRKTLLKHFAVESATAARQFPIASMNRHGVTLTYRLYQVVGDFPCLDAHAPCVLR